jgi:hypothetical protein
MILGALFSLLLVLTMPHVPYMKAVKIPEPVSLDCTECVMKVMLNMITVMIAARENLNPIIVNVG